MEEGAGNSAGLRDVMRLCREREIRRSKTQLEHKVFVAIKKKIFL